MRTVVVATAIGMSVIGLSIAADSQAAIRRTDIPAQLLRPALQQLSKDRDLQLVFRTDVVGDLRTAGAVGDLTVDEALQKLLAGTDLTFQYLDDNTITVIPAKAGIQVLPGAPPAAGATSNERTFWDRFRLAQAAPRDAAVNERTPQSSAETSPRTTQLEEVVVTAQRREERLQNVPISIAVLGGDQLDASTLQGVSEALSRVPGVATPVALQGGGTQLSVRGVSAANPVFTGSSPIAYYLDSVPFSMVKTAVAPDVDAYDLERVEVLRGPQGTLYGAGSLNGVVRVLTKDADLDRFELKARGLLSSTAYGGENWRGDMAANVPIVEDKLAARAVVSYSDLGGWIDKPSQTNANDAEMLNLRLKVNAQPTEQLSIGLSAWSSNADYGAPSFSPDNRAYPTLLDESIETDYDIYGLKLAYEFAGFTLSSASSYLDYTNNSWLDQTPTGIPGYHLRTQFSAKTLAQELNLTSSGAGPWRWTFGGIYRDSEDQTFQNGNMFFVTPQLDVFSSESFAVFGEVTRVFYDGHLELTAGLRYFEDRLTEEERIRFTGAPAAGIYGRAKFDNTSPRVVLNWKPSDTLTMYASYSEGFRSGAHHTPAILAANPSFQPTEPDTLKNYEIGTKGSFMDGKLVAEAAVFYIDWSDVQQTLRVPITSAVTLSTLVNSKSASGMGAELALTARPIDRLSLGATVSWNDLQFDDDVFSGSLLIFRAGDRLNFSPEYTAGASADYTFLLGQNGYELTLSTSVNYTSELRARRPTTATVLVSDGESLLIGGASLSLDAPSHWTARLFVDNVSNEQNPVVTDWLGATVRDMRIRPRTVGLQLDYRF